MLLTEEQARGKWCAHARTVVSNTAFNRIFARIEFVTSPEGCRCIASECMSWRWSEPNFLPRTEAEAKANPPKGYCGLAGRP
jgi:hypothetical protein